MFIHLFSQLFACEETTKTNDDTSIPTIPLSFEYDILPLFKEASCDNCHMEMVTDYELLMSLDAGSMNMGVNDMVDMSLITPYQPEISFLQYKIDGTFEQLGTNGGEQMHLFEGEEDIVRQWILSGAIQ